MEQEGLLGDKQSKVVGGEEVEIEAPTQREDYVIRVVIQGDRSLPPIITYPDLGLNHESCFGALFSQPNIHKMIFSHFCVYHINTPTKAPKKKTNNTKPFFTFDNLVDQINSVLLSCDIPSNQPPIAFGVGMGGDILSRFASKYPNKLKTLILFNSPNQLPSWWSWIWSKSSIYSLLYRGYSSSLENSFLSLYFSPETLQSKDKKVAQLVEQVRRQLEQVDKETLAKIWNSWEQRGEEAVSGLKNIKCRILSFYVLEEQERVDNSRFDQGFVETVEMEDGGRLITAEQPEKLIQPLALFLSASGLINRSFSTT